MNNGALIATWTIAILLWALACSGGWYLATRGDYSMMAAAKACHGGGRQAPAAGVDCETFRPSDVARYKAEIDRKAAISRVASALGGAAAIAMLIASRGAKRRRGADQ
jgi:hypothetical protein